jgi:hypothetical protein
MFAALHDRGKTIAAQSTLACVKQVEANKKCMLVFPITSRLTVHDFMLPVVMKVMKLLYNIMTKILRGA